MEVVLDDNGVSEYIKTGIPKPLAKNSQQIKTMKIRSLFRYLRENGR